jgi:ATP-dependent RNA helicase RhlE
MNNNYKNRKGRPFGRPFQNRGKSKKRPVGQTIDVNKLIQKGIPLEQTRYQALMSFADMPLHPALKENIDKAGFSHPTEIQEKAFGPIAELKNVIGIANTGTGKTGAFLIPIVNALLTEDEPFQTLVMVPTRELALQVEDEFKKLTRGIKLYITSVIGGQSIQNDIKNLQRPNHLIVGTPGRLTDLVKRNRLNLQDFSVLVLDEFDRMLDMGFTQDVNFLTSKMEQRDQTLLFSATIDNKQQGIIEDLIPAYAEIKVSNGLTSAEHIHQDVVRVTKEEKFAKLLEMVSDEGFEKVLVFAETKRNVGKVAENLKRSGVSVDEIHGDKTQGYRQKALRSFKSGHVKVLVATDVAARGLDISDVTHVINYEMPQNYETYIHRIGRTGRAGKVGSAFTFLN